MDRKISWEVGHNIMQIKYYIAKKHYDILRASFTLFFVTVQYCFKVKKKLLTKGLVNINIYVLPCSLESSARKVLPFKIAII